MEDIAKTKQKSLNFSSTTKEGMKGQFTRVYIQLKKKSKAQIFNKYAGG